MKALKALVYEKGEKLMGGEIPRICSCGAINENITELKKQKTGDMSNFNMCASNCQFYKNKGDYEKILKDVLHASNSFA